MQMSERDIVHKTEIMITEYVHIVHLVVNFAVEGARKARLKFVLSSI